MSETPAPQGYPELALESLPLVGEDRGNRPMWVGLALIGLAGVALFAGLEARRAPPEAPAVRPKVADYSVGTSSVPELFVPPEPNLAQRNGLEPLTPGPALPTLQLVPATPHLSPVVLRAVRPRVQPETSAAPIVPPPQPPPFVDPQQRVAVNNSPVIVYEQGGRVGDGAAGTLTPGQSTSSLARAQAARAAPGSQRVAIVPQGSLINAVLETAIDSTQAGQARALVSTDVLDREGRKVLIPRGSRLYGEYRGELSSGQRRIQLQWIRLRRPDGVTIALDSPATDPLGRAGVKGRVNSHFLEAFGGALLQSTLDLGTYAASRAISNSTVVVALPNATQNAASQLIPPPPKPTIKVKQGTQISVLVARDLDFSTVDGGQ